MHFGLVILNREPADSADTFFRSPRATLGDQSARDKSPKGQIGAENEPLVRPCATLIGSFEAAPNVQKVCQFRLSLVYASVR